MSAPASENTVAEEFGTFGLGAFLSMALQSEESSALCAEFAFSR